MTLLSHRSFPESTTIFIDFEIVAVNKLAMKKRGNKTLADIKIRLARLPALADIKRTRRIQNEDKAKRPGWRAPALKSSKHKPLVRRRAR